MNMRDKAKYLKFDLGKQPSGKIVEVSLSGPVANVKLINDSNMFNYERCREYEYTGGLITKTPKRIHIPNRGHWFIVVDTHELLGLAGEISATVNIIS